VKVSQSFQQHHKPQRPVDLTVLPSPADAPSPLPSALITSPCSRLPPPSWTLASRACRLTRALRRSIRGHSPILQTHHGTHVRDWDASMAAGCYRGLGGLRGRGEEHPRGQSQANLPPGKRRSTPFNSQLSAACPCPMLTQLLLPGQNHRDDSGGTPERPSRHSATADEPGDARSQRRPDKSITSERACR